MRSDSLGSFHCFFEESCWVGEFQFWDWWKYVRILEIWSLWSGFSFVVLNLSVNTCFWLVVDPLTNEKLILVTIEIGALAFTIIIYPVAFEVIAVSFGQYAVAVPFPFVPLAFINVSVGINHYFGHNKVGDFAFLKSFCNNNNIELHTPIMREHNGKTISSSIIRKLVKEKLF